MKDLWLDRWNDRYAKPEYAYGVQPNVYLKEQLDQLPIGKVLFAAEGEGRNAVYAAKNGWTVAAFDISKEGKRKADALAHEHKVSIDYRVGQLPELDFQAEEFDAIVLIYAHFPPQLKSSYHKLLSKYLRKGGIVIFEAFGKQHLTYRQQNEQVGGPNNIDYLFSVDELRKDFEDYEVLELVETEVELSEGLYHNGKGSVTRFVGRKK